MPIALRELSRNPSNMDDVVPFLLGVFQSFLLFSDNSVFNAGSRNLQR
jgi:hypothetical protein